MTTIDFPEKLGTTRADGKLIDSDLLAAGPGQIVVTGFIDGATSFNITILDEAGQSQTITVQKGSGGGGGSGGGWTPQLAVVNDGDRRVLQVSGWVGGTGTQPAVGQYVGPAGWSTPLGRA